MDLINQRDSVGFKRYFSEIDPLHVYDIDEGIVPNAKTAAAIADAVLNPLLGDDIDKEKPFDVVLENGNVWHISGTLPNNSFGGVAEIWIQKSDGKVLCLYHSK
jgi:hypothetical protein